MNKRLILTGCLAFYSALAFAQTTPDTLKQVDLKEVVVTGTRFALPIEKSGKTIYKLTADDLKRNAGKTVTDILNEVPGIQMEGNFGSPGTNISTYVRGGRNKNTLILIDGVPLNDPSAINATFDLRFLPVNQIESIEVLKGGLSTLYGTGASSAVINITLKEESENKIGGNFDMNYGSYNTSSISGNINGNSDQFSYLLSGNYSSSDGFSSASDENSVTSFDDDGFDQKNLLVKLGYDFNEQFSLDGNFSIDDFETEYDGGSFLDADNEQTGNMFRFGLSPNYNYSTGIIQLKTTYLANKREFKSAFPIAYEGKNLQMDLSQKHFFRNDITGLWGANYQSFAYEQEGATAFDDSQFNLFDPYASIFYETASGFNLHIGARINIHSEYDAHLVYNINPSYLFTISDDLKVKVLASAATTYITPTGFQLFSAFGNRALNPEESFNIEIGNSYYYQEIIVLNITYFDRVEDEAIDFVSQFDVNNNYIGGAYQNIEGERNVNGFETDLSIIISPNLSLATNYSMLNFDDKSSFYRIPANKFGISALFSPTENTNLTIKYNYTGERTIFDFGSFSEIELDDYALLDLNASHEFLNNGMRIFGSLNNALDKDFVSVYGFTTRGRNFNVGISYNF